jgi:hypothetical protein
MSTDLTKWAALIVALLGVLGIGNCGCDSQAVGVDQQMQLMDSRVDAAKRMHVKATVVGIIPTRAGVYWEIGFGAPGHVLVVAEVDPNAPSWDAPVTEPTSRPTAEQTEIDRRQTSASGELQSEIDALREAGHKPGGP